MSNAQHDPNVRDRDNLAEQDRHEMAYADLGAISQRLRDLIATCPKIEVNERHLSKLTDLKSIVDGMKNRYAGELARDRTPDA